MRWGDVQAGDLLIGVHEPLVLKEMYMCWLLLHRTDTHDTYYDLMEDRTFVVKKADAAKPLGTTLRILSPRGAT
jgi:hypothetical protein